MTERHEAPHPVVARVVAGEFSAGSDYDTWRPHGTTDWLLMHTIAGAGRVAGTDGAVVTAAGDTLLLRPRMIHEYGTFSDGWRLAFAHFHPRAEWSPLLEWPTRAGGVGVLRADRSIRPRILEALRTCARSSVGALPQSELFAVNALENALLWLDTQNPLRGRMDERLLQVVEHIAEDLSGTLDMTALARVAMLSPSRLSHLFTAQLGVSPQRYVERERMSRAAQLLGSTDRSITAIARDVGWDDPLYFSRRFSRLHGMSPSVYRTRHAPSRAQAPAVDARTTS